MMLLKTHIFLTGVLLAATLMAADSSPAKSAATPAAAKPAAKAVTSSSKVASRAELERKLEIYEHAAANRELAGLTQVEHGRELEEQASDLEKGVGEVKLSEYKEIYKKAGSLRKSAANLYGLASANFDKAAANRKLVANISKNLGKAEQYRSSETYAANMTLQGDEAMRMAADACEAAAVAYDRADNPTEVAANSQLAATWLEKLALR